GTPILVDGRHGLPLGGKADRGDAPPDVGAGLAHALLGRLHRGPPPVLGILLRPQGPGIHDGILVVGLGEDRPAGVKEDDFARGRGDVDGKQQRIVAHLSTSGLTMCLGRWLRRTASRFSAAMMAIFVRVSVVALAMCGASTTLSSSFRPG